MTIAGSLFIVREQQRLKNQLKRDGQSIASLVAKFCATPIEKFTYYIVQEVARNVEQSPGVAFCEIYDYKDESLVQVDTTIRGIPVAKKPRIVNKDILIIEEKIENDGKYLGRVEIGLNLAPVNAKINTYTIGIIASILVILVFVAAALYAFLSYNFISPVVSLSEAVKNLAKGNFVETNESRRNDEIGYLARTFNEMSKNLEQLYLNLERKVNERTTDLKEANDHLQQEIMVRRKAETELKKAKEAAEQANRYKSNFVTNISHEIRTPLNAIIGYAQILQNKTGFDPQDKKALQAIDRSGGHLLGLINDILDISKIEAGKVEIKPTNFDLSLLLRNVTSMFQLRCTEKSLVWQVVGIDISKEIPVFGDAGKLRQVLINLLGNAVKFTEKGGVVLRVTITEDNLYRFCVEDTGQGIPDSAKEQIFNPFSRMNGIENKEGTGLGLSITHRYLEIMGCKLEVLDNTPRGSRFCFTISLPPGNASSLPNNVQHRPIERLLTDRSLTALIVDDDRLSRSMLSHLLSKTNVVSDEASNGVEALKRLHKTVPDIIFLDRYMPEMDGLETIKAIKEQFGEAAPPVVMVTAAAFESENISPQELGISGMLIKPIEISQVLQCMVSVLGLTPVYTEELPETYEEEKRETALTSDDMHLSKSHYSLLVKAAEFGRISELKKLLKIIEDENGASPGLIETLNRYLEKYQLEELIDLLKKIHAYSE